MKVLVSSKGGRSPESQTEPTMRQACAAAVEDAASCSFFTTGSPMALEIHSSGSCRPRNHPAITFPDVSRRCVLLLLPPLLLPLLQRPPQTRRRTYACERAAHQTRNLVQLTKATTTTFGLRPTWSVRRRVRCSQSTNLRPLRANAANSQFHHSIRVVQGLRVLRWPGKVHPIARL